ncbi:MAG: molybdopterin cofactor-binding domain-containing protein [Anaerolineales bacterium]
MQLIWDVLIGLGLVVAVVALFILLVLPALRLRIAGAESRGFASHQDLDPLSWIEVLPDERIRLYVPKAEMGQGTHTGLAQIAVEELEVPWEKVEVVHASTHQAENKFRGTFGSSSISSLYNPLRQTAATMREMLRAEASRQLGVPPEKLFARDGRFEVIDDPDRAISYGTLVRQNPNWQPPREPVALKSADQFKVIGQSLPRVDARAKVTGQAVFGQDATLEGMLYGAVVRPPTVEAVMRSAQPGKAASMPGVVKVVIEKGFAGVAAHSRDQARTARDAIEVSWDRGRLWQQHELEELVTVGGPNGVTIQRQGNARSILSKGASLRAEYRTGLVAHASMETQAALVDVEGDDVKVWASTQSETVTAGQVAKALGIKPEQVEVFPTFLGGGFGRKSGSNSVASPAAEAARFARATRAPVHVGWERGEEFRNGYVRPMTHHRLSARLNGDRIEALEWKQASGDSIFGFAPALMARIVGYDPGATRGAWIHYAILHRAITVWRRRMPLSTGQWRGLGAVPNTFPIESFMDEAAYAAGRDPLQFRLDHLSNDAEDRRMAAVLNAAAQRAGWGTTPPAGHGRGIACCFYHGTLVAEVAEISLDEKTGQIRLHRVVGAVDCGRAINPDQVRSQMEGGIVMGASSALLEELTVKDGRVEAGGFAEYPLFTTAETPEIETIILETPGARPTGCGEPPVGPIAPAIANAFFSLTGVRLRQLPMTPERVKNALKK